MMITLRHNWRVGVVAAGSALILLAGCGGSADSTSSMQPVQSSKSNQAAEAEQPAAIASHQSGSSKGHGRASSPAPKRRHQKPDQGTSRRHAAAPSQKPQSNQAAETVTKVKELIGGNGGGKQRAVSTPKQIREVLQELHDQSGGPASSGDESGGGNSPSSVEEVLENLGGN